MQIPPISPGISRQQAVLRERNCGMLRKSPYETGRNLAGIGQTSDRSGEKSAAECSGRRHRARTDVVQPRRSNAHSLTPKWNRFGSLALL
jgi:hypothetical protein